MTTLIQLINEIKKKSVVAIFTINPSMFAKEEIATIEELFDVILFLNLVHEGFRVTPIFRVIKLRGELPNFQTFTYTFLGKGRLELIPID